MKPSELTMGERLEDLRKATKREDGKCLTTAEVSKRSGVSVGTINGIEKGKDNPSTTNLIKLAKFFGVSCDYLLGIHDEPSPNADIQGIGNATGLSPVAINYLCQVYKGSQTLSAILESNNLIKILLSINEVMRLKGDPRYALYNDLTDEEARAYSKMHNNPEHKMSTVAVPTKQWMQYRVYQAVDDFKDIIMNYCFPGDKEE